jgi:peptidoglycan/xylan/chitin deacetylase (PgdA/CDA1 family)
VAITVDDLPVHGPTLPGQSRLAIHQAFLSAFRAHHVPPVYGFVCAGSLDAHPEDQAAIESWVAAGNLIGNHTRTHPDLYKVTVRDYLADLDGDEPLLRKLSPETDPPTWKVFRYPFLQEGTDLASRATLRSEIRARGYRIAPVTIDFYDWAYNEPFVRCMVKHDEAAVGALKRSYLDYADGALHWADAAARALVGRPIEHILLLHVGAFDALVIDELLTRYEKQGVRFVSLDRAMADPVYAQEPRQPTAWEGTFLSQVSESRDKGGLPEPVQPEALLDALCR